MDERTEARRDEEVNTEREGQEMEWRKVRRQDEGKARGGVRREK